MTIRAHASRTAATMLDDVRVLVEPAYLASLDRLTPPLRVIVGHHIGRNDRMGCWDRRNDTFIGSAVVLAAAMAAGADKPQVCVAEAVAIQAVHDSQRLHAEIDLSLLHTHPPVAWSVFGQSSALLAADTLRAVAINELTDRASLPILARAIARLRVRRRTVAFEPLRPIELAECLRMIEQTTATLMSCACEIGAAAAGADAAQRILLAQFGCHLGMLCQLVDDIFDIWGRRDTPHSGDLAVRKMTPPIVAALTSKSPFAAELRELYSADRRDPATLATIARLAELTGARDWAEAEVDNQWAAAMSCLSRLPPDADTEELRLLSIGAKQRLCAGRRTMSIDQQEI